MKKIFALLLFLIMAFGIVACEDNDKASSTTGNNVKESTETDSIAKSDSEDSTKVISEEKQPVMPAVVTMDKGSIMGYGDNGVYVFKGISYGTYERFKYATATKSYGTEERPSFALTNGSVSPQSNTRTEYSNWAAAAAFMTPSESDMFSTESEALNLNVWTDSLEENAKKPVLVFMHGGGLENGGALELKTYDGQYFADYTDVVFVSVNARLNYVGYLDLTAIGGDENLGVADMTLSLEWVRDNISKFGGDPDNVTIMGQSGGGTKVTALASAPAAEGLFSKVVIASGGIATGITPEASTGNANKLVEYIRKNVQNMKNSSDAEVFEYLQNIKYDDLVDICESAEVSYGLTTNSPYFKADFYDKNGVVNDVASQYTYMVGSVWAEMGGKNSADAVLGDWGKGGAKPNDAKGNISMEQREEIMRKQLGDNYDKAVELLGEAYPGHDIYDLRSLVSFAGEEQADHIAKSAPAVYEYIVAYEMPYFGGMTMIHTGDMGFWFHSIDSVPYQIAGDEKNAHKLADTMASALAAFCTTGNPSTAELKWEPYTKDSHRTMVLDVDSVSKNSSYDDELLNILNVE
jgi:para-nitrobenzyl esterase